MRIAVPLTEGVVSMHFGHCEKFALIDVDEAAGKVISARELDPPAHEPGLLPRWLAGEEVNLVITGGIGQRAVMLFEAQGIKVIPGAPALSAGHVVADYLKGNLQSGSNTCDH